MAKKKIQVSTVKMTCDAQVIMIDTAFVVKITRAFMTLQSLVAQAEHIKQERVENEDGEKKWVDILDERGEPVKEYFGMDGNTIANEVFPVLQEFMDAFEEQPTKGGE